MATCGEYSADPATAEPNEESSKIPQAAALEQESATIQQVILRSALHGRSDLQLPST